MVRRTTAQHFSTALQHSTAQHSIHQVMCNQAAHLICVGHTGIVSCTLSSCTARTGKGQAQQ